MSGRTLTFLCIGGLAWTVGLHRALDLRHKPRDYALWALVASALLPGTAFFLAVEPVYRSFDALTGVPNLAILVMYGCGVVFSATMLTAMLLWTHEPRQAWPRIRTYLVAYGVVLADLVVFFTLADVPAEHPRDFTTHYGSRPLVAAFLLVFVSAFGYSLINIVLLGWRYAPLAGSRWRRRSLRISATGAAVALGFCLGTAAYLLGCWLGQAPVLAIRAGTLCACMGAALLAVGASAPVWGPRASAGAAWFGRYRAYHRLYPLWRAITDKLPHIVLEQPGCRLAQLIAVRRLNYRLYRRCIEIRDGQLALRSRQDERVAALAFDGGLAQGITGEMLRALVEATLLKSALVAPSAGTHRAAPPPARPPILGGDALHSEVRWLTQVARALPHAPVPPSQSEQMAAHDGAARSAW